MAVTITRQPENARTVNGGAVSFTVEATGVSGYTWQISGDGASWSGIAGYSGVSGANTKTLTIDPAGSWHASQLYRCLLRDASGNQTATDVVGITITGSVVITRQPADVLCAVGDQITFSVEAEGATYYKWHYSRDGKTWAPSSGSGNGTDTLTITVTEAELGLLYRCELRDASWGVVYSHAAAVLSEVRRAFAYTGEDQTFTVPVSGIYRLTVVGANGANHVSPTYGGRSIGYKALKRGDVLHVCCGQAGGFDGRAAYNGGGAGIVPTGGTAEWRTPSGSGGGATHVATAAGTLQNLTEAQVLIVAGGSGGGTGTYLMDAYKVPGGAGGGTTGAAGGIYPPGLAQAQPGTQESGYGFGRGQSATYTSVGDNKDNYSAGAGGGGFYGGYAGASMGGAGAGGSGYIGGVEAKITHKGTTYTSTTEQNYNAAGADGYALIELAARTTLPVTFDGTTLETIVYNGVEITGLIVDGTKIFFERMKRRFAAWCTSMKTAQCWMAST